MPPVTAGAAAPSTTATPPPPATVDTAAPPTTDATTTARPSSSDCSPTESPDAAASPWTSEQTARAEEIGQTPDGLAVRAVVYPGPVDTGNPWSQWGQGAVTADGHFLSATGDHRGADGNSYLYDFDPATGDLTMIGDVLSLVDHQQGAWGYGKIHAQMVPGPCGEIYAMTYWGTRRDLVYGDGYEGDLLLRLDPQARTTAVLGAPVPEHGVPSLAGSADDGVLYGEATEPTSDPDGGSFFAYDIATGESTIVDDSPDHVGFRALAVDAEGRALFTKPSGRLTRYDPSTGASEQLEGALPGEFLRAATPPAPDGTVYGVTQSPAHFIAIRPDGTIDDLGAAPGYVTSLAMEPDGSTVYFVPGAHGDSAEDDSPLYALDAATGAQEVVVRLNPMTEDALGISADGTYNVVLDAANRRLFIGFNGAAPADDESFGEVVLVEVTLPPAAGDASAAMPPASSPSGAEALTCASWPATERGGDPSLATPDGLGSDQYWVTGPTADVDGDGRLDVLLVEWEASLPSRLPLNRAAAGNVIEVAVDETLGGGPGTVVTAYEPGGSGDPEQLVSRVEISPTQGYSGGVAAVARLGVGDRQGVDIVVTPPAAFEPIELPDVPANRRLRLPAGC